MPPDSVRPLDTLFKPGVNCSTVARTRRLAPLVDAENYFAAFVQAAERAERSLIIVGWDFDSRTPLRFDAEGKPTLLLGQFLNGLCQRNPKLRISILDWDYPMIFGTDREFPPIYGLDWEPHRHIEFHFDDTHPVAGSHHQKIVVVDDKVAFTGGLDLTNKRWDSREHGAGDPRRTFLDEPYPPFHDVMVAVDGEAAAALSRIARARWHGATGNHLRAVKTRSDPWPESVEPTMREVNCAIACTAPPCENNDGVNHVEKLYLDMIARARRCIYIENQYFTSDRIANALQEKLQEPDGPEIVLVTRLLSHGWLEEATMTNLRTKLVRQLRANDPHKRLRVLYPHRGGLADGTCIDLHSKVMVVDDAWMRIGSSNLSKRSMGMDTECDLTVAAEGRPEVQQAILDFRDDLVSEHSGCEVAVLRREMQAAGSLGAAIERLGCDDRKLSELPAPELSESLLNVANIGDLEKPTPIDGLVRTFSPAPGKGKPPKLLTIVGILAAIGAGLWLLWNYTPLNSYLTRANVLALAHSLEDYWWAPLVVVASYTPASFLMFPRWAITLAAVAAFGAWEALVYAQTGVLVAAFTGYSIGRMVKRDTVRRLAGPKLNRVSAILQRGGLLSVTVVRLLPIAPFTVINMVMGAMRIRTHHFLLGTVIGMMPGMLATTILSDQVIAAFVNRGRFNAWAITAAVLAIAVVFFVGRRWIQRNSPRAS